MCGCRLAAGLMSAWSVYILRTRLNALYTGITTDVARRLAQHAGDGRQGAKSLRARGPLRLVYQAEIGDRSLASQVEYAIKQLDKTAKEAVVSEQPNAESLLETLQLLTSEEAK